MAKGPQPQVTEVKTPDPLIVKEYTPYSVLAAYNEATRARNARADYEAAKNDQATASLLGKPYTGTFDYTGQKIDTTQIPEAFDLTYAFDPERNPYYAAELEQAQKIKQNRRERMMGRRQTRREERDNMMANLFKDVKIRNPNG